MRSPNAVPLNFFTIADGSLSLNAALCVMCLSWLSSHVCFVDVEAATDSKRDENVQSTASLATDDKQKSPFTPRLLHDIRPLPKAGPRSGKGPSRKRGRTRILTDTPEKLLIEKEAAARALVKKPTLPTSDPQKQKKKGERKGKPARDLRRKNHARLPRQGVTRKVKMRKPSA